ncbi:hypothetical protein RHSIM_Rhsim03G0040600 [Rhododendron simsii]|uniref:Uncharacterized protein n=1 Tax=Rhododendron simsii TaxID=118357 RepID=A0A834LV41_RHOSS|nr:hypothetical protein RHSIM_Rhsim03G0040600 [Rhododendron simsii]
MAYTSTFLLALMVVATASVAHCVVIDGIDVAQISLTGIVTCAVTGNPLGTGVAGVTVSLSCNGGQTTIAQALSDPTGAVTIVLSTVDSAVFDQSLCFVTATLPVGTCTVSPPTGNVKSLLTLVNILDVKFRVEDRSIISSGTDRNPLVTVYPLVAGRRSVPIHSCPVDSVAIVVYLLI